MNYYITSNNFNYDYVIRCRFDIQVIDNFNIDCYFNDNFNVNEDGCGDNWCSDKFSISNYNDFMIFSLFFHELENLIINNNTNIPEILLNIFLQKNNITRLNHVLINKFGQYL